MASITHSIVMRVNLFKQPIVLVGNGPSVLNNKNGLAIDSCGTVVRFNRFKTRGFEDYVGSRTDVWAVNLGYVLYKDLHWPEVGPQPHTVVYAPLSNELYAGYDEISKLCKLPANMCPRDVAVAADAFYSGDKWASTGLMAIIHLSPCFIVGFDCFSSHDHHYCDLGARVCGDTTSPFKHHDAKREMNYVNQLEQAGLVFCL